MSSIHQEQVKRAKPGPEIQPCRIDRRKSGHQVIGQYAASPDTDTSRHGKTGHCGPPPERPDNLFPERLPFGDRNMRRGIHQNTRQQPIGKRWRCLPCGSKGCLQRVVNRRFRLCHLNIPNLCADR